MPIKSMKPDEGSYQVANYYYYYY